MLNVLIDLESNCDISGDLLSNYNVIYANKINSTDNNIKADVLVVNYKPNYLNFIMKMKVIRQINNFIKIIIVIDLLEESLIRLLYDNGIDYILVKPLDIKILILLLDKISLNNGYKILPNSKQNKIVNILSKLGMPANIKGYKYVKQALLLCLKDQDYYLHTTSKLYPSLAKKFNIKESCVEKAIRNAIELSWCRGDIEEQDRIFGYTIDKNKGRPTNGEFFAQLINYLQMY